MSKAEVKAEPCNQPGPAQRSSELLPKTMPPASVVPLSLWSDLHCFSLLMPTDPALFPDRFTITLDHLKQGLQFLPLLSGGSRKARPFLS